MKQLREGDLIRNKQTGKPLLVIWINHVCIFVIDPTSKIDPSPMQVILQRDYCHWTNDIDMECTKRNEVYNEDIKKWEYKPVFL